MRGTCAARVRARHLRLGCDSSLTRHGLGSQFLLASPARGFSRAAARPVFPDALSCFFRLRRHVEHAHLPRSLPTLYASYDCEVKICQSNLLPVHNEHSTYLHRR